MACVAGGLKWGGGTLAGQRYCYFSGHVYFQLFVFRTFTILQTAEQYCGKKILYTYMYVNEKMLSVSTYLGKRNFTLQLGVYIMLDSRCTCCICS